MDSIYCRYCWGGGRGVLVGLQGIVGFVVGFVVLGGIKGVSSKNKVFCYWKDVLAGGFNKGNLGGIYQYLVKLEVLFNSP
jgi:hypothetical protein